jgi:hypothetical protein
MTWRKLIPVGRLGRRARKACVAGGLLACTETALRLARNPALDGWLDAFNWPQLFLCAPVLFFSGATAWQLICIIAEWFNRKVGQQTEFLEPEATQNAQRTPTFWLLNSLRVSVDYIAACVIGDVPMAVKYLATARGWPLHWWWSSAVGTCLLFTIAVWWVLDRNNKQR